MILMIQTKYDHNTKFTTIIENFQNLELNGFIKNLRIKFKILPIISICQTLEQISIYKSLKILFNTIKIRMIFKI